MTKPSTQPLILSNPWNARAHASAVPAEGTTRAGATGAPRAAEGRVVGDRFNADALPPAMHQRFAQSLSATELSRAFSARVLDKHDRCMIFRHRLADQFPDTSSLVHDFDLPEHHDYTKMIEFMDTGRWPRGTATELVQLYPRLIRPLLEHADAAWKKQVHAEVAAACGNMAPDMRENVANQVERSATILCDAISVAHLQGARKLHFRGQPLLLSLPPHLTSLRQLQELTLTEMGSISKLPDGLDKLKNLESLQLVNMTALRVLPESFGALHKLKSFTALGSKLYRPFKLPEMLGSMPALRHIDVGDSELPRPTWLPENVRYEQYVPLHRRPISSDESDEENYADYASQASASNSESETDSEDGHF